MTQERITSLEAAAYTIPTETPESDGTLEWNSTTLVLVRARAGTMGGLGYTYANAAAAVYVREKLGELVRGGDAFDVDALWHTMWNAIRNDGQCGLAAMAISAVDAALWDLKANLLDLPLVTLLGGMPGEIDIYGSGGFTSYDEQQLCEQLRGWIEQGITRVKMKVGRNPASDPARVNAARRAIGDAAVLMVDANGAYSRKQAIHLAQIFAEESNVTWFEEPLPAEDLEGLRMIVQRAPSSMEITGGEYAYRLADFRRLIEAGAVDCLMADATRCGGTSGFLRAAHLCEAMNLPLSAHTAPAEHLHVCCAVKPVRHIEWFFDHVRIESMLFDGAPEQRGGRIAPDLSRAGHGLVFRDVDAQPFRVA